MSTVIAIWHESSKGKSETLREFAQLLLRTYPGYRPVFPIPAFISPAGQDFRLVVEINGTIVGIESQGDPGTRLKERLEELAVTQFRCKLILCTSRTRGSTIEAVDNLWIAHGFDVIWTSTYQIANNANHHLVNQLKARHILELVQTLGLI
jgi:hypothetical protein